MMLGRNMRYEEGYSEYVSRHGYLSEKEVEKIKEEFKQNNRKAKCQLCGKLKTDYQIEIHISDYRFRDYLKKRRIKPDDFGSYNKFIFYCCENWLPPEKYENYKKYHLYAHCTDCIGKWRMKKIDDYYHYSIVFPEGRRMEITSIYKLTEKELDEKLKEWKGVKETTEEGRKREKEFEEYEKAYEELKDEIERAETRFRKNRLKNPFCDIDCIFKKHFPYEEYCPYAEHAVIYLHKPKLGEYFLISPIGNPFLYVYNSLSKPPSLPPKECQNPEFVLENWSCCLCMYNMCYKCIDNYEKAGKYRNDFINDALEELGIPKRHYPSANRHILTKLHRLGKKFYAKRYFGYSRNAPDGHKCDSSYEFEFDKLLVENGIKHYAPTFSQAADIPFYSPLQIKDSGWVRHDNGYFSYISRPYPDFVLRGIYIEILGMKGVNGYDTQIQYKKGMVDKINKCGYNLKVIWVDPENDDFKKVISQIKKDKLG